MTILIHIPFSGRNKKVVSWGGRKSRSCRPPGTYNYPPLKDCPVFGIPHLRDSLHAPPTAQARNPGIMKFPYSSSPIFVLILLPRKVSNPSVWPQPYFSSDQSSLVSSNSLLAVSLSSILPPSNASCTLFSHDPSEECKIRHHSPAADSSKTALYPEGKFEEAYKAWWDQAPAYFPSILPDHFLQQLHTPAPLNFCSSNSTLILAFPCLLYPFPASHSPIRPSDVSS